MAEKRKFYVVWEGRAPGVYDSWDEAFEQVQAYPGARYRSFRSQEEAVEAFRRGAAESDARDLGRLLVGATEHCTAEGEPADYRLIPGIDLDGWAVDASCLGNPGVMEYRGVSLATGEEIFRVGPFRDATNNIGEFLAIVHALALMFQKGEWHTIYSDSLSGMAWVRRKQVKTTLKRTPANEKVFQLMERALLWLNVHAYSCRILKWQTDLWGEIPADFGRK